MGDAAIEGGVTDRPLPLDRRLLTEVLPEPERHGGELQPARPRPSARDAGVTVIGGGVTHLLVPRVKPRGARRSERSRRTKPSPPARPPQSLPRRDWQDRAAAGRCR